MRRPSLTDLYAGRPGVPSRRRNRAAEALSGAARGLQRGLAFQDRETDSDDDQDVLPSTTEKQGGGQGLLGGLLGGGLLASLPLVIKKLLDKKKTDTDETDSLG